MPTQSLLPDDAAQAWAKALAEELDSQELPAQAAPRAPGDWYLALTAEVQNGAVVPTYTVMDPHGRPQGSTVGPAVPAQDWAAGQPATFKAAADAEAPKVIALLGGIEARREMSDPHSLLNRPPVIYFKGVTGAPGDGNTALTRQMNTRLPALGDVLQDTPKGADFTVSCQIKTAQGAGKTTRIEIQWIVNGPHGEEDGRVVQINEVPAGSLDTYWGEVAVVVSQEAAGGIQEVITNTIDKTNKENLAKSPPAKDAALGK